MQRPKHRGVLYNDEQLGPYPDHVLKRVDRPTSDVPGPVRRAAQGDNVFARTAAGCYGEELQSLFSVMEVRNPLTAALSTFQHHLGQYSMLRPEVAPEKAPIPEDPRVMSRHLKALGYFLGADMVGIGRLPQSAIYSETATGEPIDADYRFAVVVLVRKNETAAAAASGWDHIEAGAAYLAHQHCLLQTEVMASYMRRLGIDAVPSNQANYLTLMPQIVLEAGLGEVSRMGIILNPFLGAHFKAAAVLTNVELEADGYVDFGLQGFCQRCTLCADQCPVQAIARGRKTLHNGYYTWKLNPEKCSDFNVFNREGTLCGRCAVVCPWHRPDMGPRDFEGWNGELEWLHQTVRSQRDRLAADRYLSPRERTGKWWFDLDTRDGKLVVPVEKNLEEICREHSLE